MHLSIKANPGDRLEDFISRFVIPNTQAYFLSKINHKQLIRWDKYFKDYFSQNFKKVKITAYDIVCQGILNLHQERHGDLYIISVNPNKNFPRTFAKLYDLCSIINYGVLEVSPYPIFEDTFADIAKLIPSMFDEYIEILKGE